MCKLGLWILFLFFLPSSFFHHSIFHSYFLIFTCFWLCWVSLLCRPFSSCSKQCCCLFSVYRLLTAVASLVSEHGRWDTGSVVEVDRLSCSTACGVIPDQGSNPCLLRWQADSLPLSPQGSPHSYFFIIQSHGLRKKLKDQNRKENPPTWSHSLEYPSSICCISFQKLSKSTQASLNKWEYYKLFFTFNRIPWMSFQILVCSKLPHCFTCGWWHLLGFHFCDLKNKYYCVCAPEW